MTMRRGLAQALQRNQPAPQTPGRRGLGGHGAGGHGLAHRQGVQPGPLRVGVIAGDLFQAHAVGLQPLGQVDGGQLADVGQQPRHAHARGRAGRGEGVADQHNAGLLVAGGPVEVGGAHLGGLHQLHPVQHRLEARHQGDQAPERIAAKAVHHVAAGIEIEEQVDPDRPGAGEQADEGDAVAGALAMPDQALEVAVETRPGGEGEADADRVALAQHLPFDAEAFAQAPAGARGQHGQARLHAAAAGQHDALQARPGGDRLGPVLDELHPLRPQPAHGVDQVVVAEAHFAEA